MPTVYCLYVLEPQDVTYPLSLEALDQIGSHRTTIESRAFDGFEKVERILGTVPLGLGVFAPEQVVEIHRLIERATPEQLAAIASERMATLAMDALREIVPEATRRGASVAIRVSGDDEDLAAGALVDAERERMEDEQAAALAKEDPQTVGPFMALASRFLDSLVKDEMVELAPKSSRKKLVDALAELLVKLRTDPAPGRELGRWLLAHEDIEDVFADDADLESALRATVKVVER